ncbi:MAG TPA: ubiquinone/menaquinone biosynthesis methyltransferase [Vicinamibacteria bacterium]|nr:ubiquinone/menaquinone biosynthesis methyltransferase [Vicinamibacteria bacterium]
MSEAAMAGPLATPTPGAPEKRAVRSMFDRIAPRYDLLNRLLSAGIDVRWRRRAVDLLGLGGSGRVLDLCTGTADLMIEWLERGPGCSGIGLDLSTEMLRLAAHKLRARSHPLRGFLLGGDAERLPFRSASFDGAMVAFGIRNVGDVDGALREVARVLRPGGRLVILEFGMPSGALGVLYRLYFARVLPFVGGLVSGDRGAYRYLPDSVRRFDAPEELAARLLRAGFGALEARRLTLGIAWLHGGAKA